MKVLNKSKVTKQGYWEVVLCPIGQVVLTDNWREWLDYSQLTPPRLGSTTVSKNDTCFVIERVWIDSDLHYGCNLTAQIMPYGVLSTSLLRRLNDGEEFSFTPRIIQNKLITFDLDIG